MKMNLQQLCQSHGLPFSEPAGGPRIYRIRRFRRSGGGRFGLKEFQSCAAMNANHGVIIVTVLTNGTKLH